MSSSTRSKRLLRIGATANLVNLLQKQHPADLAQVFAELGEKDRRRPFSLLVERNSKLAMEALSELGPEAGAALLADRSAEEIARLAAGPAVRRRRGDHRLPARGAVGRRPRADRRSAPGGEVGEPARVRRADRRPHHEPEGLRACRRT